MSRRLRCRMLVLLVRTVQLQRWSAAASTRQRRQRTTLLPSLAQDIKENTSGMSGEADGSLLPNQLLTVLLHTDPPATTTNSPTRSTIARVKIESHRIICSAQRLAVGRSAESTTVSINHERRTAQKRYRQNEVPHKRADRPLNRHLNYDVQPCGRKRHYKQQSSRFVQQNRAEASSEEIETYRNEKPDVTCGIWRHGVSDSASDCCYSRKSR